MNSCFGEPDRRSSMARKRRRRSARRSRHGCTALRASHGLVPGLTVVLVGEDPASQIYVRNKERAARKAGMNSDIVRLPAESTETAGARDRACAERRCRSPRDPGAVAAPGPASATSA